VSGIGVLLSLSSSGIMALAIGITAYAYDRLLRRFWWRWPVFWLAISAAGSAIFVISNNPVGWIISHLTLQPDSGYFRLLIWDAAFIQISLSPLTGYSFNSFGDYFLDNTVDSVWLVFALRFGIPTIVLLILMNITALLPSRRSAVRPGRETFEERLSRSFTLVLIMFMFIGLTVHYWNFMWIFWGLCLGVRTSLREYMMTNRRVPSSSGTTSMVSARSLPVRQPPQSYASQ
jgi:O-antigen ligase